MKYSIRLLRLGLTGLVGLAMLSGLAAADELQQALAAIKTLQVRFAQIETDQQGFEEKITYGSLQLQVPDLMRWQDDDSMQVMIANGKQLMIFERDLNQVNIYNQQQVIGSTPAVLLSRPGQFRQHFRVDSIQTSDNGSWYALSAITPNSLYDFLEVLVSDNRIQEIVIKNRVQNSSTRLQLYYHSQSLNQPIDPGVFELTIPAGVDVIKH